MQFTAGVGVLPQSHGYRVFSDNKATGRVRLQDLLAAVSCSKTYQNVMVSLDDISGNWTFQTLLTRGLKVVSTRKFGYD